MRDFLIDFKKYRSLSEGNMIALAIVDMLVDFIRDNGALPVPAAKKIIPNIQKLLAFARKNGWKIFFIADNHLENDKEFEIWGRHSVKGTVGSQVIEELTPEPGELIIPKTRYSAFYNTQLDAVLHQNKIESLIITGTLTDICVLYTAADARNRDLDVIIVSDATASLSKKRHNWALEHAKTVLNVKIKSCAEILGSSL